MVKLFFRKISELKDLKIPTVKISLKNIKLQT